MKISKNSWHYKMLTEKFFFADRWNPSRSLCLYFWQVMFRLAMGVFICMVVASPLVFLMVNVNGYLPETLGVAVAIWALLGTFILAICGMILILLFLTGVMYLVEKLKSRYFPKKEYTPKESLIINYIKAKTDKVCPIIEFKEDLK